jgi:hypothetical protein
MTLDSHEARDYVTAKLLLEFCKVAFDDRDVLCDAIDLRLETVDASDERNLTFGKHADLPAHVLELHADIAELFVAQVHDSMLVKWK